MTLTQKFNAVQAAVSWIQDGMIIGLGTGSTAAIALEMIAVRVQAGLKIQGVPTSFQTQQQAQALGIPLTDFGHITSIDLTIDGTDEVDSHLQLIKGRGGALLREKIVAFHSKEVFIVADSSKWVAELGKTPVPVEVLPFGWQGVSHKIQQQFHIQCELRHQGEAPYISDNGNFILDCPFESIPHPGAIGQALHGIPGVIEHGLFVNLATRIFIGTDVGVKEYV